jgi:hypothetical protein
VRCLAVVVTAVGVVMEVAVTAAVVTAVFADPDPSTLIGLGDASSEVG